MEQYSPVTENVSLTSSDKLGRQNVNFPHGITRISAQMINNQYVNA